MAAPDPQALEAIRVLVVDDEVNLRFAIERGLRKAGHHAESASTIRQGIERLRADAYDVVLCDLRMPGGDGEQLVRWLGSYSPSTRIVVVSAFVTPEFRREYEHSSVRVVEKPVDLAELVGLVEKIGPRRGFFGNSIEVELFDYVQMIAISGRDKWIEVTTPLGKGHIWFQHGDIVHASVGNSVGETAFYRLLSAGRGAFKEVFFRPPPERSIVHSATHLLMEAARMMDEGTLDAAWDDEASPPASAPDTQTETSFADIAAAISRDAKKPVDSITDDSLLLEADDDAPRDSLSGGDGLLLVDDDDLSRGRRVDTIPPERPLARPPATPRSRVEVRRRPPASSSIVDSATGIERLHRFLEIDGVAGAALISSTGKVLAEDMRGAGSLVTLAGFYLRGAARIARHLGNSVFDAVVSRSTVGQQMVMVSMGVMTAVLAVDKDADAERIRDEAMELAA